MNLPIVNLNDITEISDTCKKFGFFYVPMDNHIMKHAELIMNNSKAYFDQPLETKENVLMTSEGLGYAPLGRFKLDRKTAELNESFVFRPATGKEPTVEHFQSQLEAYFQMATEFGHTVFTKVIESLGLRPPGYDLGARPVGAIDGNMKLAQARAEAVVTALTTTHGIAAARLKGYGVGPLTPVASNDSDDGRAKNRRVELVKE